MLTKWRAGAHEYRLALIVAVTGSLVLALLLIVPSWILPEQSSVDNKGTRARVPAYSLPSRPVQMPAVKSKIDSTPLTSLAVTQKAGKKVVPQAEKAPSKASHLQPAPSVSRLTKSKHNLKHGYYVQAGAFKDTARARKLARSLQHAGWHVQIIIKKKALHAVLIGSWPTRARAQHARQQLAYKNKLKGFIVQQ